MASGRHPLFLVALLCSFLCLSRAGTGCDSNQQAVKLEANERTALHVIPIFGRLCFQFVVPRGSKGFSLVMSTAEGIPEMHLFKPSAQGASHGNATRIGAISIYMAGTDPDLEDGVWSLSVVSIDQSSSSAFTITLFLAATQYPSADPSDAAAVERLFQACCRGEGERSVVEEGSGVPPLVVGPCSLWRRMGGVAANFCGLPGFKCNEEGRILQIALPGSYVNNDLLQCPFPEEAVGSLKQLQALELRGNVISGEVPWAALAQLPLQVVDLAYNPIGGVLDCSLASGPLKHLDLTANDNPDDPKLSGTLPACLILMPTVQALLLGGHDLEGALPPDNGAAGVSSLARLDLRLNRLSGLLPEWLSMLTSLASLTLAGNGFSGEVPQLSQAALQILDLSTNLLSGPMPSPLGGGLRVLRLASNRLWEPLPPLDMAPGLVEVDFTNNPALAGHLDEVDWQALRQLAWMSASLCKLTNGLPEGLLSLPSLRHLDLSENALTGSLPDISGTGGSLEYLDLSSNGFSGPIPKSWASLGMAKPPSDNALPQSPGSAALFLYSNGLEGKIPDFFVPPFWPEGSTLQLGPGNRGLACPDITENGNFAGLECQRFGKKTPVRTILIGVLAPAALVVALALLGYGLWRKRESLPLPLFLSGGSQATTNGETSQRPQFFSQVRYVHFVNEA